MCCVSLSNVSIDLIIDLDLSQAEQQESADHCQFDSVTVTALGG